MGAALQIASRTKGARLDSRDLLRPLPLARGGSHRKSPANFGEVGRQLG